jgi:hypothetical protein
LEDGLTAPAKVSQLAPNSARISIHEGRNRQVRRMCEAVGSPVRRLVRTRIGPLSDPALGPGKWRNLSVREVRDLWQAARGPLPTPLPVPTRTTLACLVPGSACEPCGGQRRLTKTQSNR